MPQLLLLLACAPPPELPAEVEPATPISFAFPVESRETISSTVMGVDHDPVSYEGFEDVICTAYDGRSYPWCYDDHDGVDFDLIGEFEAMDAGSEWAIAAAPGVVIDVVDGNYDRCHFNWDTLEADCDGYPRKANYVTIEHSTGHITDYYHFMKDSIVVALGDEVARGDRLALIGSSGWSTAPHLHFEVTGPNGEEIDPYGGEHSQPESWWCDQGLPEGLPGDCPGA